MLPTIIFVILRYFRRNHPETLTRLGKRVFSNKKEIICLILCITIAMVASAQGNESITIIP